MAPPDVRDLSGYLPVSYRRQALPLAGQPPSLSQTLYGNGRELQVQRSAAP